MHISQFAVASLTHVQQTRRLLLRGMLATIAFGSLAALYWRGGPWRAGASAKSNGAEIIGRVVDLLIPRDDTPGGLDCAVDQTLLGEAARDARLDRLMSEGTAWLEHEATTRWKTKFLALPEGEQRQLITAMSGAADPVARRFFWIVRDKAYAHYYADPRSWAQLGLMGPPQPEGFPDYAEAPRRLS